MTARSARAGGLRALWRGHGRGAWLGVGLAAGALMAAPACASAPSAREPITPIPSPAVDPRRAALGARLFADPRLSGDGRRACAACHDVRANGASRTARDRTPDGRRLDHNTLTVFNAALSFRLNWTGSRRTLEAQAEASLTNPDIMAADVAVVVQRLRADRRLSQAFQAAYGRRPDKPALLDALATYERSLVTPGSRFDRWLVGDRAALTPQEARGYRLFKSVGCVACHQGVNIGGNLFQRHGIFHPLASPEPAVLRVPSLRNAGTTAPYFHDGSAPDLATAVRAMGRAQLNRTLTAQQVDDIVAFLRSLEARPAGHRFIAR